MTDQQNSESNQEHQSVPEGAVLPPMVGEEQNPQNNKDKEASVLGDSLLTNNEMKPEKRVGSTLVLSIALVLATIYLGWSLLGAIVLIEWTIMQHSIFSVLSLRPSCFGSEKRWGIEQLSIHPQFFILFR